MKTDFKIKHGRRHKDFVACIAWSSAEELISCGDDHKIYRWKIDCEDVSEVADLPASIFPTFIQFLPKCYGFLWILLVYVNYIDKF